MFLHVGAIAALFMFSWKAVAVSAVLYYITIGLGISMGYHRLHTHRSYKVPHWLEYCLRTFGTLTLEGGPIFWVATHRMHHQFSDRRAIRIRRVTARSGRTWAGSSGARAITAIPSMMCRYAPELAKHPFYVWLNNYHWVPIARPRAGLVAWGGLQMFVWAICFRVVSVCTPPGR